MKIVNYEYTDVHYGRCDNCDYTLFKSSVKDGIFLRECADAE
nr:hypothetical protein [Bacillus swezeyi]